LTAHPMLESNCVIAGGLRSVRAMSSPEAAKVGAFGHAVSPLNH
jgi:hypothetical protein